MRLPRIVFRCEPLSRGFVASGRHVVDTRRVDPDVVEVEESADGDGVVEGVVGPPRGPGALEILTSDLRRLAVHRVDEREERFLLVGDGRLAVVCEDRLDQVPIAQKLRRDRGVGADSERALVAARGEGRDELSLAGRERRRPPA